MLSPVTQSAIRHSTLILGVAVFVVTACNRQHDQSGAFDAIELGDSSAEVVAALGEPDEIRSCSDSLYWGGDHNPIGRNDGRCIEEYYYASMPGGWSVGFSDAGEVVAKYTYVSP